MTPELAPMTLDNGRVAVSFDAQGRITALTNAVTGTQLLSYPGLEDNWKVMVLTDGYPVVYILGREQTVGSPGTELEFAL